MPTDRLITTQLDDVPWVPAEKFGLPEGPVYRILKEDDGDELTSIMVKFPPGYLEPRHQHDSEHWGVVLEGEMHVDGKILAKGDFHYAPRNILHGPFYYPKGCIVYGTMFGSSILHVYSAEDAAADPAEVEVR